MIVGIVDDDPSILKFLQDQLDEYPIQTSTDPVRAREWLEQSDIDCLVTDLRMENMDGLELVRYSQDVDPPVEVIVLTGHGSVSTAVEAMKKGARDFLQKPVETDQLKIILERVDDERSQRTQLEGFRSAQQSLPGEDSLLVGSSDQIQQLRDQIEKIAPEPISVLIQGETGTGKELIAREIHRLSTRGNAPFIPLNCAAIPENLLESELFGHVQGAFTGADKTRRGKIELADGGTLFLDEIGEMPRQLQPKLLRVLEQNVITRIGAESSREIDVRFLSATNRNLADLIEENRFRKDLYYRLQMIELEAPPLRDHPDDIEDLIEHFLEQHGEADAKSWFRGEILQALREYAWPGNVRELRNVVERLLVLTDGDTLERSDLPSEITSERSQPAHRAGWEDYGDNLEQILNEIEREIIEHNLQLTAGNKAQAARRLGISRQNLHYKLERLDATNTVRSN